MCACFVKFDSEHVLVCAHAHCAISACISQGCKHLHVSKTVCICEHMSMQSCKYVFKCLHMSASQCACGSETEITGQRHGCSNLGQGSLVTAFCQKI